MVATQCKILWLCSYSSLSAVVIEWHFDVQLWNRIWDKLRDYLDKDSPTMLKRIKDTEEDLNPLIDFHVMSSMSMKGEFSVLYSVTATVVWPPIHHNSNEENPKS